MIRLLVPLLVGLSLASLSACKDTAAPTPGSGSSAVVVPMGSAAPDPAAAGSAKETSGVPGSKNLAGLGNLIPMLTDEATGRPAVKVTPEKLFDALTTAGLEVKSRKQVLAKSIEAKFCALGKIDTTTGIMGVIACEYATPALAEQGRITQDKANPIKNMAREVNGATLVIVTNVETNPDKRKQIFEVLKSL